MANEATMSASEIVAEPSISPSESSNETAPALKKIMLDINGQQHEMSADEFEKERRKVQLHKASTIKFQEAADKEKFAKEVLNLFSKDNFSGKSLKEVAKRNGLSDEQLMLAVEELMGEDVEMAKMSPTERKLYEAEMKLAEIEKEKEERENQAEERKRIMENTRYRQEHLKELNKLQGKTILNLMDPAIFQIVNGIYTRHILNNNEISLSDAVEIAEEQYKDYLDTPEDSNVYLKAILKHRLGKEYNDDEIDAILNGKKAFRERLIKETQEKKSVTPFTTSKRNVNQEEDPNTDLSPKEFFKKLKNRQI